MVFSLSIDLDKNKMFIKKELSIVMASMCSIQMLVIFNYMQGRQFLNFFPELIDASSTLFNENNVQFSTF